MKQQALINALDNFSDACQKAADNIEQKRRNILEYALDIAANGAPPTILKALKYQADLLQESKHFAFIAGGAAWLDAANLELNLM